MYVSCVMLTQQPGLIYQGYSLYKCALFPWKTKVGLRADGKSKGHGWEEGRYRQTGRGNVRLHNISALSVSIGQYGVTVQIYFFFLTHAYMYRCLFHFVINFGIFFSSSQCVARSYTSLFSFVDYGSVLGDRYRAYFGGMILHGPSAHQPCSGQFGFIQCIHEHCLMETLALISS